MRRKNVSYRGKRIVDCGALREFIDGALSDGQSAEAIAGRLQYQEKELPFVSKDTIYRYLKSPYGKLIGIRWKKKRKPKKLKKTLKLKDRIFIDKRPKIIEKRKQAGHMEADFIVSGRDGKGILLVAVCRKLRIAFLELIIDVSINEVHNAFLRIQKRFPEIKTLTLDNDILFIMHKALEQLLNIQIYFCHPYHSWEKGSIENVNKNIRKFIPKGSNLSDYNEEYIQYIERYLNGRFMKCLLYATPEEMLLSHRDNKKTAIEAADEKKTSVLIDPSG